LKGLQRLTRWLLYTVSLVGVAFSLAYLAVNISVIPERAANMQVAEQTGDDIGQAGGSRLGLAILDSTGIVAFMEKISIDLSAITPILLTWFFGAVLFSSYRYRYRTPLPKDVKARLVSRINTLPFPQRYVSIWIYWGFIGTLWGFMLIGWRMHDNKDFQAIQTLDILVKAFGTALLSTFTAVVLAFVIAPPVRYLWSWAHGAKAMQRPDEDLKRAVRRLSEEVVKTSDVVGELNKTVVLLKQSIDGVITEDYFGRFRQEFTDPIRAAVDRNKTAVVEAQQVSSEAIVKATNESRDVVVRAKDDAAAQHKAVMDGIRDLKNELSNLSGSLADVKKQQAESTDGLSRLWKSVESIVEALADLGVQVGKLGDRLEQAMSGLGTQIQKPLVDLRRLVVEQSRRVTRILKKRTVNQGPTVATVLADWLKARANRGDANSRTED